MEPDTFEVSLQGRIVECVSEDDAAAIKDADVILSNRESIAYSPVEIDRLTTVLRRYGRESAAEMLSHRASRLRAALFLKHSIGYQTPDAVN